MVGGALGRVLGQGGVLLGVLDGLGRSLSPWPGGAFPWLGGFLARGALGPGGPWPGAGNVKKPPKSRN